MTASSCRLFGSSATRDHGRRDSSLLLHLSESTAADGDPMSCVEQRVTVQTRCSGLCVGWHIVSERYNACGSETHAVRG
jgi:hypothetical protein